MFASLLPDWVALSRVVGTVCSDEVVVVDERGRIAIVWNCFIVVIGAAEQPRPRAHTLATITTSGPYREAVVLPCRGQDCVGG